MEDSRNPLTAGEIEELKALEAKATPGEWVSEPCHKGESCWCRAIGVVGDEDNYVAPSGCLSTDDAAFVAAVRNVLPRLLSMLTPPTDAALREAVRVFKLLLEDIPENSGLVFRCEEGTVRTLLRAVQSPRPLWPDDDPMIVAMAAERDALRARNEKLEQELADAIEVNTAAYMLGVESGKRDAAMLYEGRVEKLERVREAADKIKHWHDHEMSGGDGMVVSADSVRDMWSALAACEEVGNG